MGSDRNERLFLPDPVFLDRSTQQGRNFRLHKLLLRGFDVAVEGLQPTVEWPWRAKKKEAPAPGRGLMRGSLER